MRFSLQWGVCFLAMVAVAVPLGAADEKPAAEAAKTVAEAAKKVQLASIAVRSDYPEGLGGESLFGTASARLHELVERLDKAAGDDKINGVVLRLREPNIGLAKVGELRAAVARVRAQGKKVFADVHSASTRDYLVAAACDQVIMPESGSLMINGLQAEVMFFKGLFDKLGIQADFIQVGDFKGASEPFTRTGMSPEFRAQYESVINDYYEQMVEDIAHDRKLAPETVRQLIDTGMFTRQQAREAGLIDRVAYEDEWQAELKQQMGADDVALVRDYGQPKSEEDAGGMAGMMKLMEAMAGSARKKAASSKAPKIAVVYIVGSIVTGESTAGFFGGESVGSDTIVRALRKVEADPKVKAIVLRVDSPGGSALASDLIWREVVKSKKPVVVSMGDVAASGGYYVSMAAKKIFVEPGTLTGSIGVVGGKLALKGLFDKIGITTETITRGKAAGAFSTTDPFKPEEKAAYQRMMLATYSQFTTKAAQGRHMELAKLESLAGGRVFTGRQAVANGLADQIGTLDDAVAEARKLAEVPAEEKTERLMLPQPKGLLEQLLGGSSTEAEVRALAPELIQAAQMTRQLRQLFSEPAVTILPYTVHFK